MRTDDGSEGCDWTAEDEALADSANETRRHIERVNRPHPHPSVCEVVDCWVPACQALGMVRALAGGGGVSSLRILDLEQRSPEWYAARCGLVTASAMSTLISVGPPDAKSIACPSCNAEVDGPCLNARAKEPTPIKTIHAERTTAASNLPPVYAPASGDTAKALILALAAERITAYTEDNFTSRDMERGIFAEPFARDMYSEHHAEAVEVGFMIRDFDGFSIGYSPDGLVGNDGLIEIKAPRQKGELATILAGEVPAIHAPQIQTGLLVSGRKWLDFVSYCGGMPLFVKRVLPDPKWQSAILQAAEEAEVAIENTVATYRESVIGLPVAERIDFNKVELKLA